MDSPKPLTLVIGANVRRMRTDAGATLDTVAQYAREAGLKWSTGKVGDLESGRVSPTLPTLLSVCIALSAATRAPVALSDLVQCDGAVQINERLVMDGSDLVGALQGKPADQEPPEGASAAELMLAMAIRQAGGEAEQRAAQSLGITGRRFAELSHELWGRSFAEERDSRAGTGANAQKRGRVARDLKAELKARLRHGNDQ
ncbi:helix-turn-helix domain-containing protein [Rhodococcus opacus]|uniref:helix-turn-helix domain-containing protein n=1 Tax=Rhodococcus opacus TaxID=37919 RepID=UPI000AB30F10|nr:helix-turn-helix domain-containing protein [Rhodococcus opacus]